MSGFQARQEILSILSWSPCPFLVKQNHALVLLCRCKFLTSVSGSRPAQVVSNVKISFSQLTICLHWLKTKWNFSGHCPRHWRVKSKGVLWIHVKLVSVIDLQDTWLSIMSRILYPKCLDVWIGERSSNTNGQCICFHDINEPVKEEAILAIFSWRLTRLFQITYWQYTHAYQ